MKPLESLLDWCRGVNGLGQVLADAEPEIFDSLYRFLLFFCLWKWGDGWRASVLLLVIIVTAFSGVCLDSHWVCTLVRSLLHSRGRSCYSNVETPVNPFFSLCFNINMQIYLHAKWTVFIVCFSSHHWSLIALDYKSDLTHSHTPFRFGNHPSTQATYSSYWCSIFLFKSSQ